MKKLFVILLFSGCCCKSATDGQKIELTEVYVECNQIIQSDTILYEPYMIGFTFNVINYTQNNVSFGAFNPYAGGNVQFGYFEIEFDKKKKIDLKSSNMQFCLSANDTIRIISEIRDKDYSIRGWSFSEIYNLVFNSRVFYNSNKNDYKIQNDCISVFRSQEVVKNDYLILFCYNGKVVHFFPVTPR